MARTYVIRAEQAPVAVLALDEVLRTLFGGLYGAAKTLSVMLVFDPARMSATLELDFYVALE
jgi:hypothetical protein